MNTFLPRFLTFYKLSLNYTLSQRKYGLIQKQHKETLSEKKTSAEERNTDAACVDGQSSKATYDNVGMANKGVCFLQLTMLLAHYFFDKLVSSQVSHPVPL